MDAQRVPFLVLDTETTGTDASIARLVELATLSLDVNLRRIGSWTQLLNPEAPIPSDATRIHGIRPHDVVGKPLFREIAPRIQTILDCADVVVAYNADFDVRFLDAELRRAGMRGMEGLKIIDPFLTFCEHEDQGSHDLASAARFYLGLEYSERHRALNDVHATARVFIAQCRKYDGMPAAAIKSWPIPRMLSGRDLPETGTTLTVVGEGKYGLRYGRERLIVPVMLQNQQKLWAPTLTVIECLQGEFGTDPAGWIGRVIAVRQESYLKSNGARGVTVGLVQISGGGATAPAARGGG